MASTLEGGHTSLARRSFVSPEPISAILTSVSIYDTSHPKPSPVDVLVEQQAVGRSSIRSEQGCLMHFARRRIAPNTQLHFGNLVCRYGMISSILHIRLSWPLVIAIAEETARRFWPAALLFVGRIFAQTAGCVRSWPLFLRNGRELTLFWQKRNLHMMRSHGSRAFGGVGTIAKA